MRRMGQRPPEQSLLLPPLVAQVQVVGTKRTKLSKRACWLHAGEGKHVARWCLVSL